MKENISIQNRSFGLLFAGISSIFAVLSFYNGDSGSTAYVWMIMAAAFSFVALAAPGLLTPFNKAWMKLGDLMGKVVSPLVLGAIFFVLITPVALVTRLFGRDELRLKKTDASSYWIDRAPPGPAGDSFKNQF